jgi:hypothetical protein
MDIINNKTEHLLAVSEDVSQEAKAEGTNDDVF